MAGAPILMPKLGLTMTEGLLAEWKVAPGDAVTAGQVIFVVETDKISNEIEASEDGIVGELLVAEGETVPVGATVATWAGSNPPRHGEGDRREAVVEGPGALVEGPVGQDESSRPLRHAFGAPPPRSGEDRVIATPLARRRAAEAGIELATLTGSGPRGRIMAEDVIQSPSLSGERLGWGLSSGDAPTRQSPPPAPLLNGRGEEVALTPHRKATARRLTEAKRDIPHFYVFADADVTDLSALREQLNRDGAGPKLTVSAFILAALAHTLRAFPEMNRVWAGDALRELPDIDIGLAVEGPRGLVAPVVRDLGALTLDEIALAADAVITRARSGKLAAGDLEGGAVAVSNVGMFGATGLLPIINPGQSSILGVGAAQPVFRPDAAGAPVLRQVLHLALSCDHRVIDGALAARFLQALCRQLETPAALLRRPTQES